MRNHLKSTNKFDKTTPETDRQTERKIDRQTLLPAPRWGKSLG